MNMREIMEMINEAEEKAAEIKAEANDKAAGISSDADERAADIERLAEVDAKELREKTIEDAKRQAQKHYDDEIALNRAKAAGYCADRLKAGDKTVGDIVRRVTRGSR